MKAVPLSRWIIFFALAVGGCAADLAAKHGCSIGWECPASSPVWWMWTDVFGLQTSLNEGALFGMGQGFGQGLRRPVGGGGRRGPLLAVLRRRRPRPGS